MAGGRPRRAVPDLEPVLGRSLAETQLLNDPAHRTGEAARAAVRRSHTDNQDRLAARRRGFRRVVLILIALVATLGGLLWLLDA